MRIKNDPVPYISAEPLHSNILEWHYVVKGPENSPYEGGYYHGKLVFPREFPFKPPSIYMLTPSGRFNVSTRLCLSISDFHPDTWNPAWSVSTILTGLLSFMLETSPTLGSIETSDYTKRQLAAQSGAFNLKDTTFCELFPDLVQEIKANLLRRERELRNAQLRPGLGVLSSSVDSTGGLGGPLLNGHDPHHPNGIFGGTLTNLIVIVGFAAFAFAVKHILGSMMED
jgi:ubiquitin-conjugating enzyme E2 J2